MQAQRRRTQEEPVEIPVLDQDRGRWYRVLLVRSVRRGGGVVGGGLCRCCLWHFGWGCEQERLRRYYEEGKETWDQQRRLLVMVVGPLDLGSSHSS